MASPAYFEDSGTPTAEDDYGYEGLKQVLRVRLDRLQTVRYGIQYRRVHVAGRRAEVEIYIDASFQMAAEPIPHWKRKTEYHKLTLENDGKRWLFTSGM
jgi:hypothetical protein